MPDEMSPEEKLLRLIKGEKKQTPPVPPAPEESETAAQPPQQSQQEAPEKKPEKTVKPKPAPPAPKKTESADTKKDEEPTLIIPDRSEKKSVSKKDEDKPSFVVPDKKVAPPKPAPPQPDQQGQQEQKTPQPVAQPVASTEPEGDQDTKEQPVRHHHSHGIASFFIWLLSGFTFINWLLIFILLGAIGISVWHLNLLSTQRASVPMDAQPTDVPEIPVVKETASDDDFKFVAKPFPFYMEMIESKNLFRLVQPPPPPKPEKPAVEAPKEPEIKIETLTRHLVLQGIVYDIDPPQAIIFDKKENKTLFLGNGAMVTDQVKLKEIQRGKVILEFEEQTQELTF